MKALRVLLPGLMLLARAAHPQEPARCLVTAVGDIMLGRGVAKEMERRGQHYPFSGIDLTADSPTALVGNLESQLTAAEFTSPSPYRFKADPVAGGRALAGAGFTFLSLANNHSGDCGPGGFEESVFTLNSLRIGWSGRLVASGQGIDGQALAVSRPAFAERAGVRIGFLAFCQPQLLGSPELAPADSALVWRSIAAIRESCQVIIASFHWGQEYQLLPTRRQCYLGRLAVQAGASLVHGHHPHVLQGFEFYRGGLIAYSLGNYVFDQRDSLPNQSAVLKAVFRGSALDSAWLEPVQIVEKSPRLLARQNYRLFRRHLDSLNAPFGTRSRWTERGLSLLPGP